MKWRASIETRPTFSAPRNIRRMQQLRQSGVVAEAAISNAAAALAEAKSKIGRAASERRDSGWRRCIAGVEPRTSEPRHLRIRATGKAKVSPGPSRSIDQVPSESRRVGKAPSKTNSGDVRAQLSHERKRHCWIFRAARLIVDPAKKSGGDKENDAFDARATDFAIRAKCRRFIGTSRISSSFDRR